MSLDASAAYCADLVRRHDRIFYLAALLAPRAVRSDLLALAAYRVELDRAVEAASDPNVGEIRLAWWRDRIEGPGMDASTDGGPVLQALLAVQVARDLPRAALASMAEAYRFRLYADAVETKNDLEGLIGEIYGAHFVLAARILDAEPQGGLADVAGHGGLALGLGRLSAGFAKERSRGRSIVPVEMLASRGLTPAEALTGTRSTPVLHDLAQDALAHYRAARSAWDGLPAALRPAFLPAAVAPLLARRCLRAADLASRGASVDPLRAYAAVVGAAIRGLPPARP